MCSETVYQVIELTEDGKILCAISQGFALIDKATGGLVSMIEHENLRSLGFWPLPGFHIDYYPFVLTRTSKEFQMLNIKIGTVSSLLKCDCLSLHF